MKKTPKNVSHWQEKKLVIPSFCPILANYFKKTFVAQLAVIPFQETDYQKFKQKHKPQFIILQFSFSKKIKFGLVFAMADL